MGDKDFESIFGGWGKPFLIPQSSIEDYEEAARFIKGDGLIMPDNQDVPIQTIRPPNDRMPSFNFDIPKEYMEKHKKWIEQPLFDTAIDPYECMMERFGRQIVSMLIRSNPKVNKPENLKYPHKRRKKRILKKWAKIFGTTPNEIVLPKAEIEIGVMPDENGLLLYDVSSKPNKQP